MLWNRRPRSGPRRFAGPKGARAYAIGDIHGRLDLLDQILELIEADHHSRDRARCTVLFLGDLIDRGPQSCGVVDRLKSYSPSFARPIFLMGNHEEVLLRILDGEHRLVADWLTFGGSECALSYGLDPAELKTLPAREAARRISEAIPASHRQFLSTFADSASFGDYLFVHAGIRPGVALAAQSSQDLRWIRRPFLEDQREHDYMVVHGHTISEQAEVCPNRIGIDTGAYRSDRLTALGVEGRDQWFIEAKAASPPAP